MELIEFINKYSIAICILLCIIAIIFIIIGHCYREKIQMALKQEFVKLPGTTLDWWSVSHFLLFGFLGFVLPNRHFSFLMLGAAFELVEDMLSSDNTTQLADCRTKKEGIMCALSINDDYWYAKWDDVFVNLLGYTVGSSVRTTFVG